MRNTTNTERYNQQKQKVLWWMSSVIDSESLEGTLENKLGNRRSRIMCKQTCMSKKKHGVGMPNLVSLLRQPFLIRISTELKN